MKPFHTRVIQVGYEWRPAKPWRKDYTRIVAVVLYPPAVKRQLIALLAKPRLVCALLPERPGEAIPAHQTLIVAN